MSEPPPGAVLITNSTGRFGCSNAAADGAVLADGAVDAAGCPPQAAPTRRPAPRTADSRLMLECNMTALPPKDLYDHRARKGHCGLTRPRCYRSCGQPQGPTTGSVTMWERGRH